MAGSIDAIATDHAPHPGSEKMQEFETLPVRHHRPGDGDRAGAREAGAHAARFRWRGWWSCSRRVRRGSCGWAAARWRPARRATSRSSSTDREWTYDVNQSLSKSRNSPFDGRTFRGGPVATVVNGKVRLAPVKRRARTTEAFGPTKGAVMALTKYPRRLPGALPASLRSLFFFLILLGARSIAALRHRVRLVEGDGPGSRPGSTLLMYCVGARSRTAVVVFAGSVYRARARLKFGGSALAAASGMRVSRRPCCCWYRRARWRTRWSIPGPWCAISAACICPPRRRPGTIRSSVSR